MEAIESLIQSKHCMKRENSGNLSNDEIAVSARLDACAELNLNSAQNLEWLKDAGFGLFVHWSVDVQLGCVISHHLVGTSRDYQDRFFHELPKTFDPKEFDAEKLAVLAKLMGAQYVVLTTKHHNGFCLWNTKTTDFNIMNTPYHHDLLHDYTAALRKHGLKVGFYFSPEDFHFLYEQGLPITRSFTAPLSHSIMREYEALLRAQCEELFTQYGKVDMLFIDGDNAEAIKPVCWRCQPDLLITRGAIPTPEQNVPGCGYEEAWESCITMGSAWQYQPTNETYKSAARCIELLIETRAKGGSLLLNIGLDSYGRIPEPMEGRMREIAMWYFINQEAVHNVRPFTVTNDGDLWFSRDKTGTCVYCYLMRQSDWKRAERREFVLRSVNATPDTGISVLGVSGELTEYCPHLDVAPRFHQEEDGLHISVDNIQRVYCAGHINWPNPLVVRLRSVAPAFTPPAVCCGNAEVMGSTALLDGEVLDMGSFKHLSAFLLYREHPGFSSYTDGGAWSIIPAGEVSKAGDRIKVSLNGIKTGIYEYRICLRASRLDAYSQIGSFQIV